MDSMEKDGNKKETRRMMKNERVKRMVRSRGYRERASGPCGMKQCRKDGRAKE